MARSIGKVAQTSQCFSKAAKSFKSVRTSIQSFDIARVALERLIAIIHNQIVLWRREVDITYDGTLTDKQAQQKKGKQLTCGPVTKVDSLWRRRNIDRLSVEVDGHSELAGLVSRVPSGF
jgi:hypothetical protein